LAEYLFDKKEQKPLVACDIYRPAAIQQLYVVGDSIGVEVYSEPENKIQLKLLKTQSNMPGQWI
jgi:signal recognition particle subunit SRP54